MTDNEINSLFERHEKVVLQLSAGKDSAACLWLLKPYWDRLTVLWCNQGDAYIETLQYMERINALVPKFAVVYGNQPQVIKQNGFPVDVVPVDATTIGQQISGNSEITVQSFLQCCSASFWIPMNDYVKRNGFTAVIRGQRNADALKAPLQSGQIIDGIEYAFPIDDWTEEEVIEYLGERIPDSYKRGLKTSLDCMSCTAYVAENQGRIADLDNIDKEVANTIRRVHKFVFSKIMKQAELLQEITK